MSQLKFLAGAACAVVTPRVGTCLFGYQPNHRSESVHDDLHVTALALSDGEKTALVISAEIGNIHTDLCNELRAELSRHTGVPAEHIVVACTHTHSAPNLAGTEGWGAVDREYYEEFFAPGAISASAEAVASLAPAEYAVGVTESKVGINRREQEVSGSVCLGQNPWGCYDPYMTVIALRNSETKAGILNLIHYSCHGTASGINSEITRDWSGIMIDRLQAETGTLTAFYNGACGDVGPRLTNGLTTGCGDIRFAEELGGLAAFDAMRAYKSLGGYRSGTLEIFTGTLRLPYAPLPSEAEARKVLANYPEPEKLVNINRLTYFHWKQLLDYVVAGGAEKSEPMELPQTLVSMGEVLFVPFGFELFSEIARRMRVYSPYPYTLSLTNANGSLVYLPTESEMCRGGYEVNCFNTARLFPLAPNTDQNIIDENLRILRENGKTINKRGN